MHDIKSLASEFLREKVLKPNSQRAYQTDLNYFIEFCIGNKLTLSTLLKVDLAIWLAQFTGRASHRRGVNIRKFLLWVEMRKGMPIDPAFHLPWRFHDPIPANPDRPATMSDDEIESIFNARRLHLSQKAIFGLALSSGATLEEIAALKWQDLNLGKLKYMIIGESGKSRVIPLASNIANILANLKKCRQEEYGDGLGRYIFTKTNSQTPISAAYLSVIIRRLTESILGRTISPTQLHQYAKKSITEKVGLSRAMEVLGTKKASSLIRVAGEEIDLQRLRSCHAQAFQEY